jgi:hypothetical protein
MKRWQIVLIAIIVVLAVAAVVAYFPGSALTDQSVYGP